MTNDDPTPRPSFARLIREREFLILLGIVLLFFARPLFLGETFFFRDLNLLAFPQRLRLVELVRSSGVPLWDPYLHGGQPFLGDPSNVALYPTALLYFILPAATAFNLEIVGHFLLCAFAAYCLSRVLGLHPTSSLVAGAAFTLCGFTLSIANLLNRLLATPSAVLLLLFWHLFLRERKARWFTAAVVCGALVVFAGSVEFLLLTLPVALGWAMTYPYPAGSLRPARRALAWAALAAGVAGVASLQVIPGLEMVRQSTRGAGLAFQSVANWSVNPRRLPELVLPGFLGATDTLAEADYWGGRLESGYPLIVSIYFGVPVFFFALKEGLARRNAQLPKRFRRFLLVVAGAATVIAFGRFAWLTASVYRTLPFIGFFRYPVKALSAGVLPVALLAGAGAGRFAREGSPEEPPEPWTVPGVWAVTIFLGAVGAALAAGGPITDAFGRHFFLADIGGTRRSEICLPFFQASAVTLAFALVLTFLRSGRSRWRPAALAGLVILDLAAAGRRVNPYVPRSLLASEPPNASRVRRTVGAGRLFRDPTPKSHNLVAPSNRIFWNFLWRRETLDFYLGNAFGIPVVFHDDYDGLEQSRMVRLASIVRGLPWEGRLPLLSAGSVTAIISAEPLSVPGLERLEQLPGRGSQPLYLYRNASAAARVGFVSTSASADSETSAVRALLSRGFDPRRHVVLEGRAAPVSAGSCADARITEIDRTPVSWKGRISAECDGYLVFSEPFYPGWRCSVDGRVVSMLRANVAFSAIAVGPGTHEVLRAYRPASVAVGAALSALSAAVLLILALVLRRATPQRLPPSAAP